MMLMDISRVMLSENAVKSQPSIGQTLALGAGEGGMAPSLFSFPAFLGCGKLSCEYTLAEMNHFPICLSCLSVGLSVLERVFG